MRLKPGARIFGLRPEMVIALMVAEQVCQSQGYEVVITAGINGQHRRASYHYSGNGVDIRIENPRDPSKFLPDPEKAAMEIQERLGRDYNVILEHDHIHIHFSPKDMY